MVGSLCLLLSDPCRTDLISDKHGVRITSEQEFIDGKICFTLENTGEVFGFTKSFPSFEEKSF